MNIKSGRLIGVGVGIGVGEGVGVGVGVSVGEAGTGVGMGTDVIGKFGDGTGPERVLDSGSGLEYPAGPER